MTDGTITLTLTLNDGSAIEISENALLSNPKLEINNRAVSSNEFMYGSVYMGECKFAFLTQLDRYRLYGAKVSVADKSVLKGVFYVSEADRQGDYIAVTAYDRMDSFDVDITEDISGTPFELLRYVCDKFSVPLANSKNELAAFPNGTSRFRVSAETAGTYREVISYIATLLCCFATIDGDGKLRLCRFSQSIDATVDAGSRMNVKISDFETRYNRVSAVFADNTAYEAFDESINGLSLDLGNIPIVYGLATFKQKLIDNIFNELKQTVYTPCEFSYVNEKQPISLGERLFLPNAGRTGFDVETLVMEYTWKYKASCDIKAVGSNPLLKKASDIESRQRQNAQNEIAKKEIAVYAHTNITDYTVGSEDTVIATIIFSSGTNTTAVFVATVPYELDCDGNIIFSCFYDSVRLEDSDLTVYKVRGKHASTFTNYFSVTPNTQHTVVVKARTECFQSDKRKADAQLVTQNNFIEALQSQGTFTPVFVKGTIDTTVPAMSISAKSIKAILFGQGLTGVGAWDGNIFASDSVSPIAIGNFKAMLGSIGDGASVMSTISLPSAIVDSVPTVRFGSLRSVTPNVQAAVDQVILEYVINGDTALKDAINFDYNTRCVDVEETTGFGLKHKFIATSENIPIDSGKLRKTVFDNKQAQRIDAIDFYPNIMQEEM